MPSGAAPGALAGEKAGPTAVAAAGPGGLRLSELGRDGLLAGLAADGALGRAVAEGGHGHRIERALNAGMTLLCVVTGCLFPGQGYDLVLARAFGMPGAPVRPGTPVPTGSALSQARDRLGERPARRAFEPGAARDDVPVPAGGTASGLELAAVDGTTLDLHDCRELAGEFGVPDGGSNPKLRLVALVQAGTMRWLAAAIGGWHDGEGALADRLAGALRPGQLCLADRLYFSMERWLRFSAAGADLLWRVKVAPSRLPFRRLEILKDGSELVLLRESRDMLMRRRRAAPDVAAVRQFPDTTARLVTFTVLARTRSGRTRSSEIKVLTTLLDPDAFPAREIAALYAQRWKAGTAFLHLKRTVRGAGQALRGQSPALVRQEAWALLLAHNMIAAAAARTAAAAGTTLAAVSFTAAAAIVRDHVTAGAPCPHCGKRPPATLAAALAAQPLNRENRHRTSGRTKEERATWHTEPVTYELTVIPSGIQQADKHPKGGYKPKNLRAVGDAPGRQTRCPGARHHPKSHCHMRP